MLYLTCPKVALEYGKITCHMTSQHPTRKNSRFCYSSYSRNTRNSRFETGKNVENEYIYAALQIQNHTFRELPYSKSRFLHQKLLLISLVLAGVHRILHSCQNATQGSYVSNLLEKFEIIRDRNGAKIG